MIALEIGLVFAAAMLFGYFLLRSDRIENGGLYSWQRTRLLSQGASGSGRVLDHAEHSPGWSRRVRMHTVDLVVEFSPEGGPPVRVPMSYRLVDGAMSRRTEKGKTLPLRYDPHQPRRVLIDWDSIAGGPIEEPTDRQREADKERQAALLRNDKQ